MASALQCQVDTQPVFVEGILVHCNGSSAINHSGYEHTSHQPKQSLPSANPDRCACQSIRQCDVPGHRGAEESRSRDVRAWAGKGAAQSQAGPRGPEGVQGLKPCAQPCCAEQHWKQPHFSKTSLTFSSSYRTHHAVAATGCHQKAQRAPPHTSLLVASSPQGSPAGSGKGLLPCPVIGTP